MIVSFSILYFDTSKSLKIRVCTRPHTSIIIRRLNRNSTMLRTYVHRNSRSYSRRSRRKSLSSGRCVRSVIFLWYFLVHDNHAYRRWSSCRRACVSACRLPLWRQSRWGRILHWEVKCLAEERTNAYDSQIARRGRSRRWEYSPRSSVGGSVRGAPLSPLMGDLGRLAIQLQDSLELLISRTTRVDRSYRKLECECISVVRMIVLRSVFESSLYRNPTLSYLKNTLSQYSCVVLLSLKKWSPPKIVVSIRASFRTMFSGRFVKQDSNEVHWE